MFKNLATVMSILGTQATQLVAEIYQPLADRIVRWKPEGKPLVLGITAPQGSGKSTLSGLIKGLLAEKGLTVVEVSIDNLYLPLHERQALAQQNSLFGVRGAPGTHDPVLGFQIIQDLKAGKVTRIPRFDKSAAGGKGDRCPETEWETITHPPDIIILEGWFVGARPLTDAQLAITWNDTDRAPEAAKWKQLWNESLKGPYAALFGQIDRMVALIPQGGFPDVYANRLAQEHALQKELDIIPEDQRKGRKAQSDTDIQKFVEHFEPLTQAILSDPSSTLTRLDARLTIGKDRRPISISFV